MNLKDIAQEMRDIIAPDFTIWLDTIQSSVYDDTNALFEEDEYNNVGGNKVREKRTAVRIHRFGGRLQMITKRIQEMQQRLLINRVV